MGGRGDLDPVALREHLTASRRRGLPFERAWRDACAALMPEPDATAGLVLSTTRAAWAAAYERRPAQREHRAAGHLGEVLNDAAAADCERSALLG